MTDEIKSIPKVIAPLKAIRIENFRGIRDQTIELHPEVTVFFGPNASGKTTVIDAIAIGLGAIVDQVGKEGGAGYKKHDIHRLWKHEERQPSLWADDDDALFDRSMGLMNPRAGSDPFEQPYARVGIECANFRWDVTKYRSRADKPSGELDGMSEASHFLDRLIVATHEGSERTISELQAFPMFAAYGTERAVVDVPLRERDFLPYVHRLDALGGCLETNSRFKKVFEWFMDEQFSEEYDLFHFGVRTSNLEWVRLAVERARLRCKNPRILHKPISMLVDFQLAEGVTQTLDIRSLSDGIRTHFAMVLDLARRMVQLNPSDNLDAPDRGTNSEAIILIDEIDLHLDPVWQGRVIQGLRKAFPRAQFILTTHSEQVIASVPAECVRRLVLDEDQFAVERVPYAQGSTGERILIDLMGAPQRVPGDITRKLDRYRELVDRGDGEGGEAIGLRRELNHDIPEDQDLIHADFEIENQKVIQRIRARQA